MRVRTFLDAGVLIAGARATGDEQARVLRILEDPDRLFVASPFLYLELVPKAAFNKRRLEKAFYDEYFNAAESVRTVDAIVSLALTEAERVGLGAIDALHLAAAHLAGCAQFITTEKPRPESRTVIMTL